LHIEGATDVRSVVYIISSQKEKCEELRHQCHVLQEKLRYMAEQRDGLRSQLPADYPVSMATPSTRSASVQSSIRDIAELDEDPEQQRIQEEQRQLALREAERAALVLHPAAINELTGTVIRICDKANNFLKKINFNFK
jgi:hypothetical protein